MSEDWSISPPLPDKVFPWKKYNPVTREEVNEFFYSPEILVIKERMCDIGRRLWNREYVDGNGGNISVRVAQNLLLCSPTLCSKGFMTVEDICMVDMDARQKAGIRPSTSEVKTHIAMMKSVGVNACIHAPPPHCNAFLFRHQSGSGYLPGTHPAGPLRNARLSGNGPGRGGSGQTVHRRFHGKPRSHYRST